MAKSCPHCGGCLTAAKKVKNQLDTIIRDGKTYYGRIVNYTTGPAVSYCTFPDDGKPRRVSKVLKVIIEARARGDIRPGIDWFPEYIRRAQSF